MCDKHQVTFARRNFWRTVADVIYGAVLVAAAVIAVATIVGGR